MSSLHISTGFLFVSAFSVIGLTGIIMLVRHSSRKAKLEHEARMAEIQADIDARRARLDQIARTGQNFTVPAYVTAPASSVFDPHTQTQEVPRREPYTGLGRSYATPTPAYAPPAPAAPVVVQNGGGGNDMLTGVLIGNMLSHNHDHGHHDTVTHRYVDDTPSHQPSAYAGHSDSGFSWGSSDSSSSSSDSGFSFSSD